MMNESPPIDDRTQRGRERSRLRRASAPIVVLVGVALMAAACSSDAASPAVANLGSTTTTTTSAGVSPAGDSGTSSAGALAYAQCMRTHGFPGFPDPNAQGGFTDMPSGVNPASPTPQYSAANKACEPLTGAGHLSQAKQAQMEQGLLKFAQCMRSHGVPDYPDPIFTANGGVSQAIGKGSGINPSSPTFEDAQQVCRNVRPGGGS
jgi:hypothetical protein